MLVININNSINITSYSCTSQLVSILFFHFLAMKSYIFSQSLRNTFSSTQTMITCSLDSQSQKFVVPNINKIFKTTINVFNLSFS